MQNPPTKPRLPLHTLCVAFLITLLPQQAASVRAPHHQHPHWLRLASSSNEIAESSVSDLRFDPVVSDPSWREDNPTKLKCASYKAILADYNGKRWNLRLRKICNGYRSVTSVEPPTLAPRRKLSFALMLDVNLTDGELVGEIQKCPDGVVWDPFFKKCRVLQCALPGYVIRDGRCVKA